MLGSRESLQKSALNTDLQKLEQQHRQTQDVLSKMYDHNIIFPKYRNLVMVCSLYEYICAGRCHALSGCDGAYNILEMEIRLDRMITQLDYVVERLDSICQNQYMLYSVIQESNSRMRSILEATGCMARQMESIADQGERQSMALSQQMEKLQKSSAITAYQTERMQKELAYLNRMNYLAGRNDGTFFNLPPS